MFLEWIDHPLHLLDRDPASDILGKFPLASRRVLVQEVSGVLLNALNATINQQNTSGVPSHVSSLLVTANASPPAANLATTTSNTAILPTTSSSTASTALIGASFININDLISSREHLLWTMEVLAQGFVLPLEDSNLISQTCIIYSQWILDSPYRPKLIVQDQSQHLWRLIFQHLSLVFAQRKLDWKNASVANALFLKHVEICRSVLKTLLQVARSLGSHLSPESWSSLLRIVLGIADYLLHESPSSAATTTTATTSSQPIPSLSTELCPHLLKSLLEIWLRSGTRDSVLWRCFVRCFRQWMVARPDVAHHWNALVCALTQNVMNALYTSNSGDAVNLVWPQSSSPVSLTMDYELAVFMWQRAMSLVSTLKTFSPQTRSILVDGLGQLLSLIKDAIHSEVTHLKTKSALFANNPTNANTLLSLLGERLFDVVFAGTPSATSQQLNADVEISRSNAMRILCELFSLQQHREPFDKYYVAKFFLSIRVGIHHTLQLSQRRKDKLDRWMRLDYRFSCAIIRGLETIFKQVHHEPIRQDWTSTTEVPPPLSNTTFIQESTGLLRGLRLLLPDLYLLLRDMISSLYASESGTLGTLRRRRVSGIAKFSEESESLLTTGFKLLGRVIAFWPSYRTLSLSDEIRSLEGMESYFLLADLEPNIVDFLVSCIDVGWSERNFELLLHLCNRFVVQSGNLVPSLCFKLLKATSSLLNSGVIDPNSQFQEKTDRTCIVASPWSTFTVRVSVHFIENLVDLLRTSDWDPNSLEELHESIDAISRITLSMMETLAKTYDLSTKSLKRFILEADEIYKIKCSLQSHLKHYKYFLASFDEADPEFLSAYWSLVMTTEDEELPDLDKKIQQIVDNIELGLLVVAKLIALCNSDLLRGDIRCKDLFVKASLFPNISDQSVKSHDKISSLSVLKSRAQDKAKALKEDDSERSNIAYRNIRRIADKCLHDLYALSCDTSCIYRTGIGLKTDWDEEDELRKLQSWISDASDSNFEEIAPADLPQRSITYYIFNEKILIGFLDSQGEATDTDLYMVVRSGSGRFCWRLKCGQEAKAELIRPYTNEVETTVPSEKENVSTGNVGADNIQENIATAETMARRPSASPIGPNRFRLVSAPLLGNLGGLIDASRLKPRFSRDEPVICDEELYFASEEEAYLRLLKSFTAKGAYHEVGPAVEQQGDRINNFRSNHNRIGLSVYSLPEPRYISPILKLLEDIDFDDYSRFRLGRLFLSNCGFFDHICRYSWRILNSGFSYKDLKWLDSLPERTCVSATVLFASPQDTSLEDFLRRKTLISEDFVQFCEAIGEHCIIQKHKGWKGGYSRLNIADSKSNSKSSLNLDDWGLSVPYWSDIHTELIFHIPYLVDLESDDDISRESSLKSLIADDLVYVIWMEDLHQVENLCEKIYYGINDRLLLIDGESIDSIPRIVDQGVITGGFIYIFVHPIGNSDGYYLIRIHERNIGKSDGQKLSYGPLEDGNIVPRVSLGSLIRQTVISAHKYCLRNLVERKKSLPIEVNSRKPSVKELSVDEYSAFSEAHYPYSYFPHPHLYYEKPFDVRTQAIRNIARRVGRRVSPTANEFGLFYSESLR